MGGSKVKACKLLLGFTVLVKNTILGQIAACLTLLLVAHTAKNVGQHCLAAVKALYCIKTLPNSIEIPEIQLLLIFYGYIPVYCRCLPVLRRYRLPWVHLK